MKSEVIYAKHDVLRGA